jgi:hypothetical protein
MVLKMSVAEMYKELLLNRDRLKSVSGKCLGCERRIRDRIMMLKQEINRNKEKCNEHIQ